jgi:hypothetical protein
MQLLVYTSLNTPRVDYIFSTLLTALGVPSFELINNQEIYSAYNGPKVNYSSAPLCDIECWIKPVSLLYEDDIKHQLIECFIYNQQPAFFKTSGTGLPFDIFAASFYLLARYEEYLPHKLDMYGRYAHENSIAYKQGFLHLPLVNLWLKQFTHLLQEQFPSLQLQPPVFSFQPTYDIDIAWSYKHKGFLRTIGGLLRNVAKTEFNLVAGRLKTLTGITKDPFDIYDWLDHLHQKHHLNPAYFFLLAAQNGRYDKNILPSSIEYQQLIKKHAEKYTVGIHPSWQSGDDEQLFKQEVEALSQVIQQHVASSRQHYIRLTLPETYERLIATGISEDYSMGYGSINGFRASYCLPYNWYNLKNEQVTSLKIFPFCYMEANSLFEQKFSAEQAYEELQQYHNITKEVGGLLITIFHNHLLSAQPSQQGWREMYERLLQQNFTATSATQKSRQQ